MNAVQILRRWIQRDTIGLDVLGVCITAILTALTAHYLVGGGLRSIERLQQTWETMTEQAVYAEQLGTLLAVGASSLDELEAHLETEGGAVPSSMRFPDFYDSISEAAVRSGLELDRVDRGEFEEGEAYFEMRVSLEATGSYSAVYRFLNELHAMQRMVNIHRFSIRGGRDDEPHAASFELRIYSSGGEYDEYAA